MQTDEKHARSATGDSIRLALFLLPIAYCGGIIAVAIHEIVGHGLTALVTGGEFHGFVLKWDAMGWAFAAAGPLASLSQQVLVLAGGMLATTLCGLAALVFLRLVRGWPHAELTLLVVALHCLLEGPPYAFWNALHPTPPGDVAAILALLRDAGYAVTSNGLRWFSLVTGGSLSVFAIVVGGLLLFRTIEELLGRGKRLSGYRRAVALSVFVAIPGAAGWLMFDWDQVAEGIGRLPALCGAASSVLLAVVLYWKSLHPRPRARDARTSAIQITFAWAVGFVTVVLLTACFSNGVTF